MLSKASFQYQLFVFRRIFLQTSCCLVRSPRELYPQLYTEIIMLRPHCGVSLPVSPRPSGTWRNVMHTVRSVIRTGTNGMEWQEAGSAPVCIAPFNTNMVKLGRVVKPGQNGSRTGLTGGVCNSIRVSLAQA